MVEFDKYTSPKFNGFVPISSVTNTFKYRNHQMSRKQFPIQLAYSMTIGKEFSLSITYFALSRTKTWNGLALKNEFDQPRLVDINKRSAFAKIKLFYRSNIEKRMLQIPDEIRLLL